MYYKKLLLYFSIFRIVLAGVDCYLYNGLYRCYGLQLNELTNPYKNRVYELKIADSNLQEIPENAFIDFPSIRILDLSGNHIEKVAEGAFNGLSNLKTIFLSENNLTSLSLSDMPSLKELHIYKNKIWKLDLKLNKLRRLDMYDNLMTNLSFLKHLPKLKELYVMGNRLSCVDEAIFKDSPLRIVSFCSNPWQKGCGTSLVAHFKGERVTLLDEDLIAEQGSSLSSLNSSYAMRGSLRNLATGLLIAVLYRL